jgi:proteasome lid subunit RPN8/RPN11
LSGDEITFGEMSFREPERRMRPDRDRRFASLAYEVPGLADLPIFLDRIAADAIERHALSDTSVELGGILLGKECLDQQTGQPFVWVTHSLEAKHYANTQASFTYTHDSWEEITRQRDQRFPDRDIVGWYHTHPSFGIFLSHHDLFIHQNFFAQRLQVAYVVDPINQTRGFFQWRDNAMAQVAGYYLTADRGDRLALARLVNDLEQLPNSDAGSGGNLSPRLEAELINMLSRPTTRHDTTSNIERAQLATTFGLLGIFLGVLIVGAAVWLSQLQGRIQETESLKGLPAQVEKLSESLAALGDQSSAERRLLSDTLESVLSDKKPPKFDELYEKRNTQLRNANRKYESQLSTNEALAAHKKLLEAEAADLRAQLDVSKKECNDLKFEAQKAESLIASLKRQAKEALESSSDSVDGGKKDGNFQEFARMRYWAYGGWACTALLSLGLLAAYIYFKPLVDDAAGIDKGAGTDDHPTHRIE